MKRTTARNENNVMKNLQLPAPVPALDITGPRVGVLHHVEETADAVALPGDAFVTDFDLHVEQAFAIVREA